jgi:L-erythro-3,5-diaminohexanoate dehydrogenase
MLLGSVAEVSPAHPAHGSLRVGQRIATLVSLTLTPLHLKAIKSVDVKTDRVEVSGHAILFPSGPFALLPDDLPEKLALSALDVCGAPALVARYAHPGNTVAVLGAGKSGALCLAQARKSAGPKGRLIAMDINAAALAELKSANLCDEIRQVDATNPIAVLDAISSATNGQLCDLVVNCASVPNTEMATLFSVKERGTALFFSMATRFGAVALGAEGVAKDAQLVIGNGYAQGHAELTLGLLRSHPALMSLFVRRYG